MLKSNTRTFAAVALVCAVLFTALGVFVSHRPPLAFETALEAAFAGRATGVALVFTRSCYWYVLVAFGASAIGLAVLVPAWRARAIFSIVVTIAGWQASDLLKLAFGRARPGQWYEIHESTFGYPSGHAMFALVVYGLWAYFVWTSNLRFRAPPAAALAFWAVGILWSRLALGAHYPTDLLGGLLLGGFLLATGFAIAPVVWSRSGPDKAANSL